MLEQNKRPLQFAGTKSWCTAAKSLLLSDKKVSLSTRVFLLFHRKEEIFFSFQLKGV